MKRIVTMMLMLLLVGGATQVQAQSWLKKLGKKVEEKAKSKVEEKAEKAVDKAFDKAEDAVTGKGKEKKDNNNAADGGDNTDADGQDVAQDGGQQKGQSLEMTYAKSDFVAGDEIIFDDPMDKEQMGEFPSMWDLYYGVCEVASVDGKKAILLTDRWTSIGPLMKNPKNYLGDIFTIEFDYYQPALEQFHNDWIQLIFHGPDMDAKDEIIKINRATWHKDTQTMNWEWQTSSGESKGSTQFILTGNEWHHFAISFNKRAFKLYIDGVRYINIPNLATPPGWFDISVQNAAGHFFLTNFRIAKGAVPLYDRMMSDGKFITYGITFDVGKSTIKPESMGEINRIVQLMTENPDLKFSVEGHTDSTGNAASNQTLSEARSAAIVTKLVEMGISADRLTSSGKGQNNPIADNGTDEGRAKNRRVEFVKI